MNFDYMQAYNNGWEDCAKAERNNPNATKSEVIFATQTWESTHRHVEGELYRFEFEVKIKIWDGSWLSGVVYSDSKGNKYSTDFERWKRRFVQLPEPRKFFPRPK